MKWFFLFSLPALFAQSTFTNDALFALQQIRTVIPERQWEQEFSILVDEAGFEEQARKMTDHKWRETSIPVTFAIANSGYYYLNSTMSGETIRILDWYQEFEEGVFWRTARMMDRLYYLENQ